MMLKKWTKMIFLGASVLTLVACSSTTKNNSNMARYDDGSRVVDAANDTAETSGLGTQSKFSGEKVADASAANSHLASRKIYYFDFDKEIVHEEYKPEITAHANYLVTHRDTKILVEGHTDPRGSREYNIGLGERRAKSVVAILTSSGVSPAQIRVVSYGAEKLAMPGHTETEFQKDRRVVLVYAQN